MTLIANAPDTENPSSGCPFHHGETVPALTTPHTPIPSQTIEIDVDGVWHVRGYEEARQILRSPHIKQAGFGAELLHETGVMTRDPILYMEGDEHRQYRKETARFFTPTTTQQNYREMMTRYADEIIADFKHKGRADISNLSLQMAVLVASQIVGLTDTRVPSLQARLNKVVDLDIKQSWSWRDRIDFVFMQATLLAFYWLDVKPAIKARRQNPQEDVISYLIERGYTDREILTECLTFGEAGIVTTREFISVALWHILQRDDLRDIMQDGDEAERYKLLHEILRLEPVVGNLLRRTTDEFTIESKGETITIPEGTLIDLNIYGTNTDELVTGHAPDEVCPAREMKAMRPKVPEFMMSFGDGNHRCPGAYVAIQESDIFIRKLLEIESLRIEQVPTVKRKDIIKGYEIRNFILAV